MRCQFAVVGINAALTQAILLASASLSADSGSNFCVAFSLLVVLFQLCGEYWILDHWVVL